MPLVCWFGKRCLHIDAQVGGTNAVSQDVKGPKPMQDTCPAHTKHVILIPNHTYTWRCEHAHQVRDYRYYNYQQPMMVKMALLTAFAALFLCNSCGE